MGRLQSAIDIAEGLAYLHQRNVMFRDLKPDNIGFDHKGTAKIFDFGLAKEIFPEDEEKGNTGLVGTFRYMAPEIAKCKQYGLSSDAYSYGILLWEICKMQRPFAKYSKQELSEKVIYGDKRPKPASSWPASVVGTMQMCWSGDKEDRPCLTVVADILKNEIERSVQEWKEEAKPRRHQVLRRNSIQVGTIVGGEVSRQYNDNESDQEEEPPTPSFRKRVGRKLSMAASFRDLEF